MKPPYKIPSMVEIDATPKNGFTVASTFTGAGGSCLGFKQAGFQTVYASEFIEAARDTYTKNFPGVPLDSRDIRETQPADIFEMSGVSEIDVLEGSPPCASFSISGPRESHWGKVNLYSNTHQRTDDLFFEYIRLLRGIRPKVFVAENVLGMTIGMSKYYLKKVMSELKASGYVVEARVIDASWLGVPQRRKRLIFIGVRDDLNRQPVFPDPLPYQYTVGDALLDCPEPTADQVYKMPKSFLRQYNKLSYGQRSGKYVQLRRCSYDKPSLTITQTLAANPMHPGEPRFFTIPEMRRLFGFPDDFILTGIFRKQWERIGRAVCPPVMHAVAACIRDSILPRQ